MSSLMPTLDATENFAISETLPQAAVMPDSGASLRLAQLAARVADDNRGRDIMILDTRPLTSMFDYFVIATGTSRRQLGAISDEIEQVVKRELDDRALGVEGFRESQWILLDYGDVVIHLFDEPTREFYALEGLWSDAAKVPFTPAQGSAAIAAATVSDA